MSATESSGRAAGRRRFQAVAVAAVVVIVVAAAAVLVGRSGGSSGPGRPRLPLAAGGASTAGGPGGATVGPATAPAPTASTTYRWAGTVPTLAGHAPAYRLRAVAGTGPVGALAAALGLHGPVQADATGWTVTSGDAVLRVTAADGQWSYSATGSCIGIAAVQGGTGGIVCSGGAATAGGAAGVGSAEPPATAGAGGASASAGAISPPGSQSSVASPPPTVTGSTVTANRCLPVPCPAGTRCPAICVPAPAATDLPTGDQAGQQARHILAQAGLAVADADVTATGAAWADLVSVDPRVGGLPTLGLRSSFTIGSKGAVESASGVLVDPTRIADYPLVGTAAGFARLQAGRDLLWGGAVPLATPQSATAREVTVTGAHLGLVRAAGSDGGYLVPAYVFEVAGSNGLPPAVAAVGDADLQTVQPGGPARQVTPPVPAPASPPSSGPTDATVAPALAPKGSSSPGPTSRPGPPASD